MAQTFHRRTELLFVLAAIVSFGFFSIYEYLWGGLAFLAALVLLWQVRKDEKGLEIEAQPDSYAGFWKRLGSQLVDGATCMIFTMLPSYLVSTGTLQPLARQFLYLAYLAAVFYMLKRWGQSPGKMVLGIKVVRTDLTPIGWKEILVRNWYDIFYGAFYSFEYFWAYWLVSPAVPGQAQDQEFPAFFIATRQAVLGFNGFWIVSELLVLLTNQRKRALHDYLAGTLVIVEEKPNPLSRRKTALVAVSVVAIMVGCLLSVSQMSSSSLLLAHAGDPSAQFMIGKHYYSGSEVTQNKEEAYRWFYKSAEQGNKFAQEYLGKMYENGEGVKADKAEAIKWYKLASKNGNYKAKKDLQRLGAEP